MRKCYKRIRNTKDTDAKQTNTRKRNVYKKNKKERGPKFQTCVLLFLLCIPMPKRLVRLSWHCLVQTQPQRVQV